jgi:hypothetical protein
MARERSPTRDPYRSDSPRSRSLDVGDAALLVPCTSLPAQWAFIGVRRDQVHTLLKGLEKIAASADIPMLVTGDFNSTPGSAPHSLLANGRVDASHPELATDPLGILRPPSKLCHQLPLLRCGSLRQVPGERLNQDEGPRTVSFIIGRMW